MTELKQSEIDYLLYLVHEHDGSVLDYHLPDKVEKDVFGNSIPSVRAFKRLDKLGLVVITDALVDDDGFEWSPSVDITDEGRAYLKENKLA